MADGDNFSAFAPRSLPLGKETESLFCSQAFDTEYHPLCHDDDHNQERIQVCIGDRVQTSGNG